MIKVLVVEDDPMVAKINCDYIARMSKYEVMKVVNNGEDAYQYLKENEMVDLIILDIFMPKLNGMELLERIRNDFNRIDVIFVTAAREKNMIQRGLQLGAVDYLIKPFTFERIAQALDKYEKRFLMFHQQEELNQECIDTLFENIQPKTELPKGIHPDTLNLIGENIENLEVIEVKEIAHLLKISTVTIRHYLDYFVDQGVLVRITKYGTVGRPNYVYHKK